MLYGVVLLYILFLVCRFELSGKHASKSIKNLHLVFLFLILCLIASLRYRLAPDTVWYSTYFENESIPISELSFKKISDAKYQPLWTILNSIARSIGGYYVFQTIVAFLLHIFIFNFILKSTSKVFTALLFYYISCYFYFSMEILRESLALSLFLLAIIDYDNRNYRNAMLKFFASVLFHQFAAVLIISFVFVHKKINPLLKLMLIAIPLIFLLYLDDPLGSLFDITGEVGGYDITIYSLTAQLTPAGYFYNILRFLPCVYVMIMYRSIAIPGLKMSKEVVFACCLIYVGIVMVRITSIPYVDRFANYFAFFQIILTSCVLQTEFRRFAKSVYPPFLIFFIAVIMLIYTILPLTYPHSDYERPVYKRYYPYSNFITKEIDADREYMILYEAKE